MESDRSHAPQARRTDGSISGSGGADGARCSRDQTAALLMIKIEPLENHPELVPLCACWNFEEWGQAVGRTLQETIDGFEPFLNPAGQQKAFIGFDNDLPAGLVLLIDNDLESHPHLKPWLASLFVVP